MNEVTAQAILDELKKLNAGVAQMLCYQRMMADAKRRPSPMSPTTVSVVQRPDPLGTKVPSDARQPDPLRAPSPI